MAAEEDTTLDCGHEFSKGWTPEFEKQVEKVNTEHQAVNPTQRNRELDKKGLVSGSINLGVIKITVGNLAKALKKVMGSEESQHKNEAGNLNREIKREQYRFGYNDADAEDAEIACCNHPNCGNNAENVQEQLIEAQDVNEADEFLDEYRDLKDEHGFRNTAKKENHQTNTLDRRTKTTAQNTVSWEQARNRGGGDRKTEVQQDTTSKQYVEIDEDGDRGEVSSRTETDVGRSPSEGDNDEYLQIDTEDTSSDHEVTTIGLSTSQGDTPSIKEVEQTRDSTTSNREKEVGEGGSEGETEASWVGVVMSTETFSEIGEGLKMVEESSEGEISEMKKRGKMFHDPNQVRQADRETRDSGEQEGAIQGYGMV